MHRPVYPYRLINLLQSFAQSMGNYPDDRIGLRVEIAAPPKRFGRDPMLIDLVVLIEEVLLAYINQHAGQIAGSA